MRESYDVVVIGSGLGGSITACRLAQAGRSVCILERGRRWTNVDFPRRAIPFPPPDGTVTRPRPGPACLRPIERSADRLSPRLRPTRGARGSEADSPSLIIFLPRS